MPQFIEPPEERRLTDLNAPHVAFKSKTGKILFAKESIGIHIGADQVWHFPNFEEAADFAKRMAAQQPQQPQP